MRAKQKKKDIPKVDGLSAKDIAKIRSACRVVWHRSYPRKLCVQRATGKDGFMRCEQCAKKVPKIHVDHIEPVGKVNGGFIKRLFCPSKRLKALCDRCHRAKTKQEREALAIERLIG